MKNIFRLLAVFVLAGAGTAFAQNWPNKPIHVIIPWPPGQATDLAMRMVGEKLAPVLGQPLIMENKPGAGGTIGTDQVTKMAPDGYTLLAASSGPMSIAPNVEKLRYDPRKDFTTISLFAINPFVMVVNPALPASNLKEFIALLKANPDKYSYSSSGSGATSHLMVALFNSMAGIKAVHVPYKGSTQAVTDVVNGQVAYTVETVPTVLSFVNSGRLKALAISSARRSSAMPALAPVAEAGDLPGYDMFGWIGLMAPAGLPREIAARLSAEVQKIMQAPEIRERFIALGLEPAPPGSTPEEFGAFVTKQYERYGTAVRQAKVKLD
ncbi:MAG TPA: tripartite tricarboxylate transporter substrate binding protein [Burkholderiales bacterium]